VRSSFRRPPCTFPRAVLVLREAADSDVPESTRARHSPLDMPGTMTIATIPGPVPGADTPPASLLLDRLDDKRPGIVRGPQEIDQNGDHKPEEPSKMSKH